MIFLPSKCAKATKYTQVCPANSTCKDKCNGFECNCDQGFHKEGDKCVPDCDANQCLANPCQPRADCNDQCKGYECACQSGFSLTEKNECCDKDQCKYDKPCPENSSCTDKCVGFECQCEEGFHMENEKCVPLCDENQCAQGELNDNIKDLKSRQRGGLLLFFSELTFNYFQETLIPRVCALKDLTV